jgi:fermentation-respiration switch protein FrsA (DUF1100 family)
VETTVESDGLALPAHLARPPLSAGRGRKCGLVLCHGFPVLPSGARHSGEGYPEFAARLANEAGWAVLTFTFRGAGASEGDFSLAGWLADLRAAVDRLAVEEDVGGVWLAGFSTGGALALCGAAEDERVRGVAALAAPADFGDWAADPRRFLDECRRVGLVRTPGFPPDVDAWARQLKEVRPLALVAKVPPRPLLLVHGSDDQVVPLSDARALADAAEGHCELRVVTSAGHRLRHDPRAVALLLGWLHRQHL